MSTTVARCPCGTGDSYADCCGRFHADGATAATPATAVALMRSRFSAFAVGDVAYLHRTWHPSTRPDTIELDDDVRWTRLDILDTVQGGPFDTTGIVEFEAHRRSPTGRGVMHERSSFVRVDGRWLYLTGTIVST